VSTDTIKVFVNPVPVVTLNPTFICVGFSTTLDAGNPGCTYNWSTGETTQTVSVSDSGNISVVVTSANGCSSMGSTLITTGGNITANPTTVNICAGQTTTLNAGNPGATYAWSTGATTQSITSGTAGNYYVTITDVNGCAATMLNIINVDPLPVLNFTSTPTCFGDAINFTNTSTVASGSIASNLWAFGDSYSSSTASPSHTYTAAGTFSVSLTATTQAGCTSSITRSVTINPLPVADFSTTTVCLGGSNQFTSNSTVPTGNITSWNWNFGDGSNGSGASASHTYASAGTYASTLVVTTNNNCQDTITQNVIVHGLPVADFTFNNGCAQSQISFTNASQSSFGPITSYQWDFGNGTSSTTADNTISYSNAGTFTASLIVTTSQGCTDTVSQNVTSYPLPVATFNATSACTNTAVNISNNSSIASGSIQNYYWNFGDNSTASTASPSHAYATAGNYQITMITTSDMGCRDTAVQNITSYALPTISFQTENACLGIDVDFLNTSSLNGGGNTWAWDFGDGTTSTDFEPSHNYNHPGNFTIQLTGTTTNGCTVSNTNSLNIYPNPVAAFSVSNICLGGANQFVNQSSVDGGISFTSVWTMADGTTNTTTNPSHTFAAAGAYNIALTVTTPNGCTAQVSHDLRVYNPPVARFLGDDVCQGLSTHFIDQSHSQDGNIVGWVWNFGDNSNSVEGNPSHNYTSPDTYQVTLTTTSVYGCFDTYSDTVQVFARPSAAIVANSACEGSPVQFANASAGVGVVSYSWDLGNGFTTSDSVFSYTFGAAGMYDVTLVAVDQNNCTSTELARVEVYPNPTPAFAATEVCQNSTTNFTNQSYVAGGSTIVSYNWNFGDNGTSSLTNPTHAFSQPGTYNVNLVAVTDHGCVQVTTIPARVNPNPVALFAAGAQGCGPITGSFTGASSISEGSITGWLWNFGDGEISTDQNPSHTFETTGNYDVSLTVVSDRGCYASYTGQNVVKVYPSPTADFSTDVVVTDIMNPTVHFDNQSSNYTAYQWMFGDGTSTNSVFSPTHTFSDTGTYSAWLITTNAYGCKDTAFKSIEVRPLSTLFVPNCFTPNGDGKNDVFRPLHTNMVDLQVWVFDRWGLLLKTWNSLDGSWDGFYEGKKCQEDTYVYKIVGDGVDGKHSEWVGHVSIVY
jgi:gliding motility-associated-like protein